MHDHSFYRTTGLRDFSWNLTFDEIEQLDAGSFFSDTFAGEKIPSLEEVIELTGYVAELQAEDTDESKARIDQMLFIAKFLCHVTHKCFPGTASCC